MDNEKYYKDVIKQYIESEISAEDAMEMLVQIKGMDSKSYDPRTYRKYKRKHFVFARNLFSRLFNKTTLGFASGVIGINLMLIMNRFLDGHVRDMAMTSQAIKMIMLYETMLIILTFAFCMAHEVKILHRMGIKVLSLDLLRLDPTGEFTEDKEEE